MGNVQTRWMPQRLIALLAATLQTGWVAASDERAVQTDALEMEQIVVRGAYFGQRVAHGTKTPTLLLDLPQSVSVVSAERIAEQAMTSVADVMQYSPGVSVAQGEDHRDQITLRGQNTTADFFIDGLRDDVQYFRPLYNLERVEILRGANALLFGRGGGGGVVNRVTKTAELDNSFHELRAGFDTFSGGVVAVDSNRALGNQQAFRFNALTERQESHRDYKDGERWAINPTYTWELGDNTVLNASWERLDDDRVVDRGVPSSGARPLTGQRDTFFGDPDTNRTTLSADITRLRLDHRFANHWRANATLQSARYDKFYANLYPVAFDASQETVTLDGYQDGTARDNHIVQLNIVGEMHWAGMDHTVLMGAEWGSQKSSNWRRDARFDATQDDQITLDFTNPLVIPGYSHTGRVRDTQSKVTFHSAFFQDEIALNAHWILVAGARWDQFEITVDDAIAEQKASATGQLARRDKQVSPRLGLIYKPSDNVSFYLSHSRSFLPRSGDQFLTLTPSTATLAPEMFDNTELGVKWRVATGLDIALAGFEIERENGTAVDPNNPERSVLTGTQTRGVELQLDGQLGSAWSINTSYTYLDAEEMGRFVQGSSANRTLPSLPKHKATLWSAWQMNSQWRLGLGVIHQSEQYASLSEQVTLPAFTRVDAALHWDVTTDLSLQLNVENLLDRDYFSAAHNDNNISVGKPINARLTATYQF